MSLFIIWSQIRALKVMFAKLGHSKIWKNCTQKLFGIIINQNLKFDEYILTQCKKAGRKIKALARVYTYLSLEGRRTLIKAFIESVCVLSINLDVLSKIFKYSNKSST